MAQFFVLPKVNVRILTNKKSLSPYYYLTICADESTGSRKVWSYENLPVGISAHLQFRRQKPFFEQRKPVGNSDWSRALNRFNSIAPWPAFV